MRKRISVGPILLAALGLLVSCTPVSRTALPQMHQNPDALPQIHGVLLEDRVIDGEVVLAADLLVPAGRTLTLRPGTTVFVRPDPSTKIDPEWLSPETLLVRGTLRIEGTVERPVTFLPLALPEGQSVAWAGILFDRAAASTVRNARIFQAETGILMIGSSPLIRDSLIEGCRYGLVIQDGSAGQVTGNLIRNGEAGVFCWRGSRPELRGNRISGHEEEGLFVDRSSLPRLADNLVTGKDLGLVAYDPQLAAQVGRLTGNREDFRLLGEGSVQ